VWLWHLDVNDDECHRQADNNLSDLPIGWVFVTVYGVVGGYLGMFELPIEFSVIFLSHFLTRVYYSFSWGIYYSIHLLTRVFIFMELLSFSCGILFIFVRHSTQTKKRRSLIDDSYSTVSEVDIPSVDSKLKKKEFRCLQCSFLW